MNWAPMSMIIHLGTLNQKIMLLKNFTVSFPVMLMTGSAVIICWLGMEQLTFKGQRSMLFSNIDHRSGNRGL
jgi:hypothetical protein